MVESGHQEQPQEVTAAANQATPQIGQSLADLQAKGPANFMKYGYRHQAALAMCDGDSGDPELEKRIAYAMLECFELWKERHHKYGRGNIAEFGAQGCLVRASDKMARLRKAYFDGTGDMPDESIEDSWKDGVNYFIMGLVCHRGGWPTATEETRQGMPCV